MAPSSIPPPLPPTVEEAYRRKCVQLKHRTKEVSNANEAAHLRLNRIKRQVEKMRLERAFLLEQLARRTSTNVEDSDGSPSPPPTPKDKPLRTKRNHRKGSLLAGASNIETPPPAGGASGSVTGGAHAASSGLLTAQNLRANTHSPSGSEALSHSHAGDRAKSTNGTAASATATTNGKQGVVKKPFDYYAEERRPSLLRKAAAADDEDEAPDTAARVEDELAREWKNLSEDERAPYREQAEGASSSKAPPAPPSAAAPEDATPAATQDEDVEMGNYDTDDDQETQGEKADE